MDKSGKSSENNIHLINVPSIRLLLYFASFYLYLYFFTMLVMLGIIDVTRNGFLYIVVAFIFLILFIYLLIISVYYDNVLIVDESKISVEKWVDYLRHKNRRNSYPLQKLSYENLVKDNYDRWIGPIRIQLHSEDKIEVINISNIGLYSFINELGKAGLIDKNDSDWNKKSVKGEFHTNAVFWFIFKLLFLGAALVALSSFHIYNLFVVFSTLAIIIFYPTRLWRS